MNHKEVAERIAKSLGENNLVTAAHCATRLRLVVRDSQDIDQEALDNDPDLKGTFEANGQYQIIVGPGDVNKVYAELVNLTNVKEASKEEIKELANEQENTNPIMRFIKVMSDIFVPLIPALTAGGLIMAVNNVLTSQGLFGPESLVEMFPAWADFADMINMFASAPFAFLPILIGFSATKRFGGNQFLGAAIGMMMVMPQLVNGYNVAATQAAGEMPVWNLFGFEISQAGYQGQVLPVIGVAWILAKLENFFHKHLKDAIDFTFTPMLAVILTGIITFAFVGPVLRTLSDFLMNGLVDIITLLGGIGYGIFGLFYSAIVLTGLHQSFPAIETALIADVVNTGGNFIFPIASAANVAQGAAALAVYFIAKDEKTKGLATSSSISAMLGITEPAMFGVNLKLRYPFFIALASAGAGAIIQGVFGVRSQSLGPAGLIGFIAIIPRHIPMFMVSLVVSIVLAFTLTLLYGKRKQQQAEKEEAEAIKEQEVLKTTSTSTATVVETVVAPVAGEVVELSTVNDPVFAQAMMGQGVGIKPNDGKVIAPISGEITFLNESKHAYGLRSESGVEVLIHIGIDTVNMEGEGFTTQVSQGDHVEVGQELGTFNREKIEQAGYDATVMVIITNTADWDAVDVVAPQTVSLKSEIIEVK